MSEYKVGDKFIIEIGDVFSNDADDFIIEEETLYKVKGFKSLVFDSFGLDKLQKYEEEVIATKFYEKGRKEALQEVQNCEAYGYEKGLQDAWELNQKLFVGVNDGGWSGKKIKDIFGMVGYEVITEMTPREALAKLEAYEKEKAKIKAGDVVTIFPRSGGKYDAIVVRVKVQGYIDAIYSDGITTNNVPPELYKKTGKHIDIQDILKRISED